MKPLSKIVDKLWSAKVKSIKAAPLSAVSDPFEMYERLTLNRAVSHYKTLAREFNRLQGKKSNADDSIWTTTLNSKLLVLQIRINEFYQKFWSDHIVKMAAKSKDKELAAAIKEYFQVYK